MSPQSKLRRTGLALSAGTVALVFAGPATVAEAGGCPPGEGLVSTLTGVICATTETVTGSGRRVIDGATDGTTAPLTGAVKDGADGLAAGVHGTAAATEGTSRGKDGGSERRAPAKRKKAATHQEPTWTSFPNGYTPRERMRFLDSRFPAPPPVPPRPATFGWPDSATLPGVRPPQVAPGQPHIVAAPQHRPGAGAISLTGPGGQPTPIAIAVAAAAAGAVVAMHLGMVDTWRRRRPRREST